MTGGLGMIGSLVASWLVRQSASDVVLLGRSGRPGADSGAVMDLVTGSGSTAAITLVRCDAASQDEMRALVEASSGAKPLQVRLLTIAVMFPAIASCCCFAFLRDLLGCHWQEPSHG